MIILKASHSDLKQILEVAADCRSLLKEKGIPQWQGAYPSQNDFEKDIELERLYVLKENDEVAGFFALVYPDHNYDYIEDGKWLETSEYIAVHRMGIAKKYRLKGYSKMAFDYIKDKYRHIRVDTHLLNERMNKTLKDNGFIYCGVVYMEDHTKRNAYEWILK